MPNTGGGRRVATGGLAAGDERGASRLEETTRIVVNELFGMDGSDTCLRFARLVVALDGRGAEACPLLAPPVAASALGYRKAGRATKASGNWGLRDTRDS